MEHGKNLQLMYIAFLVVFAAGLFLVVSVDTSDKGECKKSIDGKMLVRQPNSKHFIEREFCVLIQI